jgi:hypothetical protein
MTANSQENMDEERRVILNNLRVLLGRIGSANDAEDHGYIEEAVQMRNDSCEAIRELMAEHAFLTGMLPSLQLELDTQHILGFGWSNLCDEVDKLIAT